MALRIVRDLTKKQMEQMDPNTIIVLYDSDTGIMDYRHVERILYSFQRLSGLIDADPERLQMIFTYVSDTLDELRRSGLTPQQTVQAIATGSTTMEHLRMIDSIMWLNIYAALTQDRPLKMVVNPPPQRGPWDTLMTQTLH